jgi:hypothetical protein
LRYISLISYWIFAVFYGDVLRSSVYIFGAVVCVTVGAVHRSCVVRREEGVGIRMGNFPEVRIFVCWGPVNFLWYVFNRRISV